ncbi:MAG: DNA polymerase III subunit delta [Bacteroidales bacterium]|jgi:DNA polymerase-3 subunit delta'|nr:DNA polymerase III subunit delta [Bacteroidales bacterium]
MYFRDIIGLTDIKKHLIESVQKGYVPHARMIYGAEGIGKLPLAIAYSRYLNCLNPHDTDSCGECSSCSKYDKLAHPDLHFAFPMVQKRAEKLMVCDNYLPQWRAFLAEKTYFNLGQWLQFINAKNAQGMIYAQESEEIIRKLNLKVYEAKYKIMIVWLPEKMNIECANKLLKMIEEPPAHTIFLLVSEDLDKVIPTIKSRCQPIYIKPIDHSAMISAIQQNYNLTASDSHSVAHIANGSFTKAIELIESSDDSQILLNLFSKMMGAAYSKNIKLIKEVADELSKTGREVQKSFLIFSLRMFREYFVKNFNVPELIYLNRAEQQLGQQYSGTINETNIEVLVDEFSLGHRQIEQNGNAKIIFLDLCLKLTMLIKK